MTTRKPTEFKLKVVQEAFDSVLSQAIQSELRFVSKRDTPEFREMVIGGVVRLRCDKFTNHVTHDFLNLGLTVTSSAPASVDRNPAVPLLAGSSTERLYFDDFTVTAKHVKDLSHAVADMLFDAALALADSHEATTVSLEVKLRAGAILSRRLYGANFKPSFAARGYVKELWKWLLDHPTACLTRKVFGYHIGFAEYTRTLEHLPLIQKVMRETPNLAPLLGWSIREYHNHLWRQAPEQLNRTGLTVETVEAAWKPFSLITAWETSPADIFFGLRKSLMAGLPGTEPLTAAGWKVLAHMSAEGVRACASFGKVSSTMVRQLNLLAKIGEKDIPLSMLRTILHAEKDAPQSAVLLDSRHQDLRIRFVRIAIRAARIEKKKGQLESFLLHEYELMLDWLNRQGFEQGLPGVSSHWDSLMRRQVEWHERVILEALARQGKESWTSLLPSFEIGKVVVTPLVTAQELAQEGADMRHCVGTYVHECLLGQSRIFHLKGPKRQNSTLELKNSARPSCAAAWVINQNRAYGNKVPSETLKQAALEVQVRYQAAERAATKGT